MWSDSNYSPNYQHNLFKCIEFPFVLTQFPKGSQGGNANSHLIFLGTNISFSALLNPWFSKVTQVVPVFLVRKHLWWFAAHPGTSGYGCPVAALTTTEPKPSCEGNVDFWSKRKMVPWTKITSQVHWLGTQNGLDGGIFQDSFPVKLDDNGNITIFKQKIHFLFPLVMLVFGGLSRFPGSTHGDEPSFVHYERNTFIIYDICFYFDLLHTLPFSFFYRLASSSAQPPLSICRT